MFTGFSKKEFIQSFLAALSMVGTVYVFSVGFYYCFSILQMMTFSLMSYTMTLSLINNKLARILEGSVNL